MLKIDNINQLHIRQQEGKLLHFSVINSVQRPQIGNPQELLKKLQKAVENIFILQTKDMSFMDLNSTIQRLVTINQGEKLYLGLKSWIMLNSQVLFGSLRLAEDAAIMLHNLVNAWKEFELRIRAIQDIFFLLEERFIKYNKYAGIHPVGVGIFKDLVLDRTNALSRIPEAIISETKREMRGEYINKSEINEVVKMLLALDSILNLTLYQTFAMKPYLKYIKEFYRAEAKRELNNLTCAEYIQLVEREIRKETIRCNSIFDFTIAKQVKSILHQYFVYDMAVDILNRDGKGLKSLLAQEKTEDIRSTYCLFSINTRCLEIFVNTYKTCIEDEGMKLIKEFVQGQSTIKLPQNLQSGYQIGVNRYLK